MRTIHDIDCNVVRDCHREFCSGPNSTCYVKPERKYTFTKMALLVEEYVMADDFKVTFEEWMEKRGKR